MILLRQRGFIFAAVERVVAVPERFPFGKIVRFDRSNEEVCFSSQTILFLPLLIRDYLMHSDPGLLTELQHRTHTPLLNPAQSSAREFPIAFPLIMATPLIYWLHALWKI